MASTEEKKSFYDYSDDEVKDDGVSMGWNVFEITRATQDSWDDGNPRLSMNTQVAEGDEAGKFGPFLTLSLGESRFSYKDNRGRDAVRVTTAEANLKLLIKVTRTILGRNPRLTDPYDVGPTMLQEIGDELEGQRFIGEVKVSRGGKKYIVSQTIHNYDRPPEGFVPPGVLENMGGLPTFGKTNPWDKEDDDADLPF